IELRPPERLLQRQATVVPGSPEDESVGVVGVREVEVAGMHDPASVTERSPRLLWPRARPSCGDWREETPMPCGGDQTLATRSVVRVTSPAQTPQLTCGRSGLPQGLCVSVADTGDGAAQRSPQAIIASGTW